MGLPYSVLHGVRIIHEALQLGERGDSIPDVGAGVVLAVAVVGLVFLGLTLLQGGPIALAIPLLVYWGAGLWFGPSGKTSLRVTRTLGSDRVRPGEPVSVTVTLENAGDDLEEVTVRDRVPPGLEVMEGQTSALGPLPSGGKLVLRYTVRGPRGSYRFGNVEVAVGEPFHVRPRTELVEAPRQLFVLPEVRALRRVEIRPRQTRLHAGLVPARRGGPGTEFYGVRAYQPGDPLRSLNPWAMARDPERLYITEFEQERSADVGIIVDARRRADAHVGSMSLFEHSIEAAAALADAFLQGGHRVGLLVYGGHLDWTFPGTGRVQREKILRTLARARLGESLVFEGFDYLPTRLFPARSQIVLVSPLLPGDETMLIALRAHGYAVLIVSPDPVSFEAKGFPDDEATRLAERIARVERALLLRRLQRAGIVVVDWNVEVPFVQRVQGALARSPLWLRPLGVRA